MEGAPPIVNGIAIQQKDRYEEAEQRVRPSVPKTKNALSQEMVIVYPYTMRGNAQDLNHSKELTFNSQPLYMPHQ